MTIKKGVSLIALIITIAVLVIMAGAIIQRGMARTDDARIAKHNQNISTTQEEVENYYYYKGAELPVVNLTPYPVPQGSSLEAEIIKNGEQNDTFYTVDLSKLGKVAGKDGTTGGNDLYIVSSVRHTVYYAKGDTVKGVTYHGLITKNNVKLAQIVTPTSGAAQPPSGAWDGTVNGPKLAAGMTPVKWNGSAWVKADSTNAGHDWYDYTVGVNKWANVMLSDGCDGSTTFNGSMLVWIPRYTYKILTGEHSSTTGTIDIRFTNGTADDTSGSYRVHPAFYWGGWTIQGFIDMAKLGGGTEVTGIWVGKFEPSNNGGKIKIAPNITSWRNLSVDSIFTSCRSMSSDTATYGINSTVDTHMLKNSEWGASAYLSIYVLGATEVAMNSSGTYITAGGNIVTNKAQSTTGNEYGIYDMAGCTWEYVAAYVDNNDPAIDNNGGSLKLAGNQYKDKFPKGTSDMAGPNYAVTNKAYGHAIYETSWNGDSGSYGWFSDYCYFPSTNNPFLIRSAGNGTGNFGGIFYYGNCTGGAASDGSFRVSAVIP